MASTDARLLCPLLHCRAVAYPLYIAWNLTPSLSPPPNPYLHPTRQNRYIVDPKFYRHRVQRVHAAIYAAFFSGCILSSGSSTGITNPHSANAHSNPMDPFKVPEHTLAFEKRKALLILGSACTLPPSRIPPADCGDIRPAGASIDTAHTNTLSCLLHPRLTGKEDSVQRHCSVRLCCGP